MEWNCQNTIHRWGSFRMLRDRVGRKQGQEVANLLQSFIGPLDQWLDQQIDRRLVRTFFLALAAIVRLRHSQVGTAAERIGRPRALPGPGPGRYQAAQQSVALSQVVPNTLGEVSLAKGGPGAYPAGGSGRVGPGHLGRKRAGETGKYRPGGVVPGPLQQGSPSQAHQARLLQSAGRTAGIRSRPAMAHRLGGRDAGASRPGRHALVDQPGQIGQPPAGADHIPAFPVRRRVAEAGGPRLRPGIRRSALAQGAERTPTAVHHALAHPLPAGRRRG